MKISTLQDLAHSSEATSLGVWVVTQLLRTNRRRISLICGSPHAGKSTLARQLAVAVVNGKPFLDRETTQSKVAYWTCEESDEDIKADFLQSGMALTEPNFVVLQSTALEDNLNALDKCLDADPDIRLVILETLDDFLQVDDLDNNTATRKAFEKLDAVVQKHTHRCCFVALHHFKKSDEQKGSSLHRILGATVIAGRTDAKIFMRGCGDSDHRRVISVQLRKGTPIEPTYLDFDTTTQSSTLGKTIADEKSNATKVTKSSAQADIRQRCIDVIAQNEGMTHRSVCDTVGAKTQRSNDMLHELMKDGVVISHRGLLYIKGREPKPSSKEELTLELEDSQRRLDTAKAYAGQYPNNPHWQIEVPRLEQVIADLSGKLTEGICTN
jgi:AAA domain-containing protein